jgi:hypothetical protein
VEEGVIDALIEQGGAIRADGGARTTHSIGASILVNALSEEIFTIKTVEDPDTEGNGDIFVNASVERVIGFGKVTLTLAAHRDTVFADGVSISGS